LAAPNYAATARERLVEVADLANEYVAAHEALFRNALRHYQETWLAMERSGKPHVAQLRKGRRMDWISYA
jgi:hypothetical protein